LNLLDLGNNRISYITKSNELPQDLAFLNLQGNPCSITDNRNSLLRTVNPQESIEQFSCFKNFGLLPFGDPQDSAPSPGLSERHYSDSNNLASSARSKSSCWKNVSSRINTGLNKAFVSKFLK
jgi:hypothetical protein